MHAPAASRRCLLLLLAARAAAAPAALTGSLAYLTCDAGARGACVAASLHLAARDLASGATSVLARFPNASLDTLALSAMALSEAADALFISLVAADGAAGELVRFSLSERKVVARVAAPPCGVLAVGDAPSPASLICLTDAPYYGVDGKSYLLRLDAASGAAARLSTWEGSPVPEDAVAVLDPRAGGVFYAVLLEEAQDAEFIVGWNATTGEKLSQVAVPETLGLLNAVWEPHSARVLGVLDDYSAQARYFAALNLSAGSWAPISTALQKYEAVYGIAAAAPALGAVFVEAAGSRAGAVDVVGVSVAEGAVLYDKPSGGLCTSLVYLPTAASSR